MRNIKVKNVKMRFRPSHFPFTAMYEPPKIAGLEPIIRHGRERMGAKLVPTNPRGVAALLKALKRSEAIGILPDQEPDWGSGVFAPFYGRDAYTATLLPKLVARTQARVVTGVALRIPGKGFEIHFLDADEQVYSEEDATSATGVNASVEASIALDPAQYTLCALVHSERWVCASTFAGLLLQHLDSQATAPYLLTSDATSLKLWSRRCQTLVAVNMFRMLYKKRCV